MIFYITLRFGQVDLTLEVPLRLSEETPKQKLFHFVSGYGCSLFFIRNPNRKNRSKTEYKKI